MEITLTRKTITKIIGILLAISVLSGGWYAWSQGMLRGWFAKAEAVQASPDDEPALASLTALYSPNGERLDWEEQVCNGMTEQGCELFHAMFADPLWKASAKEKTVTVVFIKDVETLEDGSQVWKTEVSDGETSSPVYIHVAQNEAGQWLLNRVLFSQEAAKYENQQGNLP